MNTETYKMSVRGSKNKIIIYIAGACSIAFVILLYHNASQRLEAMEVAYERCHLNEESLSAQLQVNLEYKVRLEKSLQQEKSDHTQTKEELQKRLEEERQKRQMETFNKISPLQQQNKNLQTQLVEAHHELEKLTRQLSELSELAIQRQEEIKNLKNDVTLLKESKQDFDELKMKIIKLEKENSILLEDRRELLIKTENFGKFKEILSASNIKLLDNPQGNLIEKNRRNETVICLPVSSKSASLSPNNIKSSTVANKIERELFPSANSFFANTSTPMINPQAIQDDDKIPVAHMPQPRQESSSMKISNLFDKKDGTRFRPELAKDSVNEIGVAQGVLGAPDILNHFDHVPEIQNYKKKLKEADTNNHGGEVGDEEVPLVKNMDNIHNWREGEMREQALIGGHPAINEIPKNLNYQYAAEDDVRKENEDDDDVDGFDYHVKEKNMDVKENGLKPVQPQTPFAVKHDSVMLQPK